MRITILGSASGLPVTDRNPSGLLFETASESVLIDAGEGSVRQILRYEYDLDRIVSVVISHTHVDHVSGLFMVLQYFHLTNRERPFRIYLPAGVMPSFPKILPVLQLFKEKWSYTVEFIPLSDGHVLSGRSL